MDREKERERERERKENNILESDGADATAHLDTRLKKCVLQASHKDTMIVDAGRREQATGLQEGRDAGVLVLVRAQLRPGVAEDPRDQDALLAHGHGVLRSHLPIRLARVLRDPGLGLHPAMSYMEDIRYPITCCFGTIYTLSFSNHIKLVM